MVYSHILHDGLFCIWSAIPKPGRGQSYVKLPACISYLFVNQFVYQDDEMWTKDSCSIINDYFNILVLMKRNCLCFHSPFSFDFLGLSI